MKAIVEFDDQGLTYGALKTLVRSKMITLDDVGWGMEGEEERK